MISHDRTADQSHEYLGCNDFFGQGSSFTGLRMHASLSRPTHMGSLHGQDQIMPVVERGAGVDDMHCSRNHARSCTCRDVCTGYGQSCSSSVHETRFTAQNICLSHTKDLGKVSALASALRLHGCALAMCVYFTENTGFDSCTCT